MKYIFLTEQFYKDYEKCPEIEQKRFRPYIMLLVKIDNLTFALPLRSHIKHPYAFFTDNENQPLVRRYHLNKKLTFFRRLSIVSLSAFIIKNS